MVARIHLWAGLVLGIYMALMSLTGAVLVFAEEIETALHPELFRVASKNQAPVSRLIRSAQASYPDRTITAFYTPSGNRQTAVAYMRKGDEILYAYIDPATAQVLGATTPSTSFIRFLREFHFNLFSGRSGRAVNGAGALALAALAVTGIILWWPGVRCWRKRLRPRFNTNWNTHATIGLWSAAMISMWALTGYNFSYPLLPRPPVESQPTTARNAIDVDALVEQALHRSPASRLYGVQMPTGARTPYIVFVAPSLHSEKRHCDYHYFDQYSGAYLNLWRRGAPYTPAEAIVASFVPLHFGSFGGTPLKTLWSIMGLSPALLFATGFLIWLRRLG